MWGFLCDDEASKDGFVFVLLLRAEELVVIDCRIEGRRKPSFSPKLVIPLTALAAWSSSCENWNCLLVAKEDRVVTEGRVNADAAEADTVCGKADDSWCKGVHCDSSAALDWRKRSYASRLAVDFKARSFLVSVSAGTNVPRCNDRCWSSDAVDARSKEDPRLKLPPPLVGEGKVLGSEALFRNWDLNDHATLS